MREKLYRATDNNEEYRENYEAIDWGHLYGEVKHISGEAMPFDENMGGRVNDYNPQFKVGDTVHYSNACTVVEVSLSGSLIKIKRDYDINEVSLHPACGFLPAPLYANPEDYMMEINSLKRENERLRKKLRG